MPARRLPRVLRFRVNQIAFFRTRLLPGGTWRRAYRLEKAKLITIAAVLLESGLEEPEVIDRLRDSRMDRANALMKLKAAVIACE